jgi:hypothetical protein
MGIGQQVACQQEQTIGPEFQYRGAARGRVKTCRGVGGHLLYGTGTGSTALYSKPWGCYARHPRCLLAPSPERSAIRRR